VGELVFLLFYFFAFFPFHRTIISKFYFP
jgi:hypothetical protein